MGKGTRNRQVRAEDKVTNPQKYVKKKKTNMPAFIGPMVFGIIAVLLVAVMVGTSLVNAGTFMRARTAVETEDIDVNGAMMTYCINSTYANYLNYFYEVYSSILSSSSSSTGNINIYNYMGIDPNVSLKKQVYDKESGQTWFEYIADMAVAQVEEQLVYAQAAKEAGVKLEAEDLALIEETMTSMKSYADKYGYSVNDYIALNYGRGVREKDVRAVLELTQLASKYAQMINDDLYAASTEEKVEAYYQENKIDFLSADYLSYQFKATLNANAENKDELYAQDKAAVDAAAAELAQVTSEQDFKDYIKSYVAESLVDEYMSKYYSGYLAEAEGETDEEKAAAAEQKVMDKVAEDAAAKTEGLLTEDYASEEDSELSDWIFGTNGGIAASENTAYAATAVESEAKDSYTVTVYFLVREASRVEDTTRTFTYLLLEDEKYSADQAQQALDAFANGEHTSSALLAMGEDYKNNAACQTLSEVALGETGVDELDAWLFAEERVAGDYTLISYTYEDVKFHVLVLVDEIGPAEWYIACRDAQVSAEMSDWYDEATKTYAVTVHQAVVNNVDL